MIKKIIRVLLIKEGQYWVANGLEDDMASQAHTEKDVLDDLGKMFDKTDELVLEGYAARRLSAPAEYIRAWERGIPYQSAYPLGRSRVAEVRKCRADDDPYMQWATSQRNK